MTIVVAPKVISATTISKVDEDDSLNVKLSNLQEK